MFSGLFVFGTAIADKNSDTLSSFYWDSQNQNKKGKQMNIRNVLTAVVGVLIAIAYIAGSAYLLATMPNDNRGGLILVEAVIAIVFHLIALSKVKRGTLTVYRNWTDFGISCAWPISIMLTGIAAVAMTVCEGSTGKTICLILTIVFAVVAAASLIWMFVGAFNNNKGRLFGGLIALSARVTASMLFLTWLSKLLEVKNNYHDSNVGVGEYVKSVIGFIMFGIWFRMLVIPMVADNRNED